MTSLSLRKHDQTSSEFLPYSISNFSSCQGIRNSDPGIQNYGMRNDGMEMQKQKRQRNAERGLKLAEKGIKRRERNIFFSHMNAYRPKIVVEEINVEFH